MTTGVNGFDVSQFIIARAEDWKVRYALSDVVEEIRALLDEDEITTELASRMVATIIESLIYSTIMTAEEADEAERLQGPITEDEIKNWTERLGLPIEGDTEEEK